MLHHFKHTIHRYINNYESLPARPVLLRTPMGTGNKKYNNDGVIVQGVYKIATSRTAKHVYTRPCTISVQSLAIYFDNSTTHCDCPQTTRIVTVMSGRIKTR